MEDLKNSNKKKDPLAFWKKYKLIADTASYMLRPKTLRVCRFCDKTENETSFKMRAHILPELLGKNDIIGIEECDNCNKLFSGYESHLSIFFRPYLAVVGVKGKTNVPDFHSRTFNDNEDTRSIFRFNSEGSRQFIIGDLDDYKVDIANKRMAVKFRLPPHRPRLIYKALLKVALSLLPLEKKTKYQNLFNWLSNRTDKIDFFSPMFITLLDAKKFRTPFAQLYEAKRVIRKKTFIPELTLVISFGNVTAQIFLPLSLQFNYEASRGKGIILEIFPAFAFNINTDGMNENDTIHVNYNFRSII